MAEFGGASYSCSEEGLSLLSLASDYNKEEIPTLEDREFQSGVEQRNWAGLPRDVLSMIFKKITSVDIIRSAQYVCRPWRQLSFEPELWRRIFVTLPDDLEDVSALESLAMFALDRSQGCVEDLHLQSIDCKKDELFNYMSHRTTKLRRLRLISICIMSETALAQAIRNFPELEELEITFCFVSSKLVEIVGPACLQLKSFKLNVKQYSYQRDYNSDGWPSVFTNENSDAVAFSIAKHMQQLQHLQLIGGGLTNVGLHAILDSCLNLQCLDIRACLNVNFDENLKRKCAKIKELRPPKDSTADFEFSAIFGNANSYDTDTDDDYHDIMRFAGY